MTDWIQSLNEKFTSYSKAEFDYIESTDINQAKKIDLGASGIYMEASVIDFEIKNLNFIIKEFGRRDAALVYTKCNEIISAIAERTGGFVNDFSPNSILIIYPGKEEAMTNSIKGAMKVVSALCETFKPHFSSITGFEFGMGIDHGHIMGIKTLSDGNFEKITWFGSCIYKAIRICKESSRPFYISISGCIYRNLGNDMKTATRRILGIKKKERGCMDQDLIYL